jgi:signal transduction histidine kinase/CheY-like chemotaxis protein
MGMTEPRLHPLLVRHLTAAGIDPDETPTASAWNAVLRQLDETYADRDTARKELSEANERAQRAIDGERARAHFIANLSHELKTPLNAILGYSELLAEELAVVRAGSLVEDVRRVERAGRHLLGLINDVLDLAKFDAGLVELTHTRFPVANLLEEVAEEARPSMMDGQNRFVVNVPPDLGMITADPHRLRQCLQHVLVYAAKHNQNSDVRMWAHRDGNVLVIEVVDDGPGLTPAQRSLLFEENGVADAATTRQYGGAGLGLALTRRFLSRMGGDIQLESAPGDGSRFTLSLPDRDGLVAPEPGPVAKPGLPPDPDTPVDDDDRRLVLVIDDDPDVHEIVRRILDREGIQVAGAPDGESGIALARELRPRAIVLDLILPGASGWEILSRIKSDPDLAHTPVVVLSTLDDRSRGLTVGADEYLVKPVDRQALLEAVRRHISGRDSDVLLVDDDFATRRLMRTFLQRAGLPVRTAANGQEALDRVREQRPGLIVLDLVMPVMDGPTFLRHLRSEAVFDDVAVVVTTAKDLTAAERKDLDASVERVLDKHAASMEELLQQVAEIAGR